LQDPEGRTPLFFAAFFGHKEAVERILASRHHVYALKPGGFDVVSPATKARSLGFYETADVIESYAANPGRIRWILRKKLGLNGCLFLFSILVLLCSSCIIPFPALMVLSHPSPVSADLLALMVLFSDNYLELKDQEKIQSVEKGENFKRFFCIVQKLSLELQMVVALRAEKEPGFLIPLNEIELAIHALFHLCSSACGDN